MAGSASMIIYDYDRLMARLSISWTSDASGDVNGVSFPFIRGTIIAVDFVPGSGGSQPTSLYDVTLLNGHGDDLLEGAGANLSNTLGNHRGVFMQTADKTAFARQWCHGGLFQLVVTGAGDTKSGVVDIFIFYGVL